MHAGLVLRGRRSVGAERHVRSGPLLRGGLEHADAEPLREHDVLSSRQPSTNNVSCVCVLRDEWHGQLHALHGRVLLQCNGPVGRIGRLRAGHLLPAGLDGARAVPRWRILRVGSHVGAHAVHARFVLRDRGPLCGDQRVRIG